MIAFASVHAFSTNYFLPTGHLVALTSGCVAAYLFKRGHRQRLETIIRHQVLGVSLIVTPCIAFIGYRSASENLGFIVQAAVCAATAVLILHLCWSEHHGIASRLMTLPPVLWVGRRSYGLYLYHRTLTALIPALIPGITLKFAAPLVLALAFVVADVIPFGGAPGEPSRPSAPAPAWVSKGAARRVHTSYSKRQLVRRSRQSSAQ